MLGDVFEGRTRPCIFRLPVDTNSFQVWARACEIERVVVFLGAALFQTLAYIFIERGFGGNCAVAPRYSYSVVFLGLQVGYYASAIRYMIASLLWWKLSNILKCCCFIEYDRFSVRFKNGLFGVTTSLLSVYPMQSQQFCRASNTTPVRATQRAGDAARKAKHHTPADGLSDLLLDPTHQT